MPRIFGFLVALGLSTVALDSRAAPDITLDAKAWSLVTRESGPINYYAVTSDDGGTFVRSRYAPPMKTAVLGWQVPEADRRAARTLAWKWRVQKLPVGGDECVSGKGDSGAVVYVTWKRTLRYYTIKYVWSSVGTKGKVCDQKRNPFVAQDTVIVDSGGPLNAWKTVQLDLAAEYRNHFEKGDPKAEVPDFVGIGLMSDGDQTQSESSADFGTFTVTR